MNGDKHSSLLGPFVSQEENEGLQIQPKIPDMLYTPCLLGSSYLTLSRGRLDTQHNDIQHYATQHNDINHNDTHNI